METVAPTPMPPPTPPRPGAPGAPVHEHRTLFPEVLLLSLPDTRGYAEAFLLWRCLEPGCKHACHATGMVHEQSRHLTVANWQARLAEERATGSVEAQMAQRQERRKVR